jgi:hypothetical protein
MQEIRDHVQESGLRDAVLIQKVEGQFDEAGVIWAKFRGEAEEPKKQLQNIAVKKSDRPKKGRAQGLQDKCADVLGEIRGAADHEFVFADQNQGRKALGKGDAQFCEKTIFADGVDLALEKN